MNEQRKVVYALRDQVGPAGWRFQVVDEYLPETVEALVQAHCVSST